MNTYLRVLGPLGTSMTSVLRLNGVLYCWHSLTFNQKTPEPCFRGSSAPDPSSRVHTLLLSGPKDTDLSPLFPVTHTTPAHIPHSATYHMVVPSSPPQIYGKDHNVRSHSRRSFYVAMNTLPLPRTLSKRTDNIILGKLSP